MMQPLIVLPRAKAARIRQLGRHSKVRHAEGAFLMEGLKPICEVLNSHASAVLEIVLKAGFLERTEPAFREMLVRSAAPKYVCLDPVFNQLTDLTTSSGILAVVRQPAWDQEAVFQRPQIFGVYGECLQDPTNVGAIIRTAAAFEVDAVWLSVDSADIFNPKVVRASAGSLLQLPVFLVKDSSECIEHGCTILASQPPESTSRPIREIRSVPAKTVIAVGNEGRGLSNRTLTQASLRFHIPMSPLIDSLNVAVSTAIAIFSLRGLPRNKADHQSRGKTATM